MNDNQSQRRPATESESPLGKSKSERFWQVFWLAFLVVSLAYAGYSFYAPSNHIAWVADYTTAQQQAVTSDKPIILFFSGTWCSPCQIMKRQVWADEQVMERVNEAFIPVTIDVDNPDAAALVSRYEVWATPTTILADSKGNVLQYKQGGMSKADFLEFIGRVDQSPVEDFSS